MLTSSIKTMHDEFTHLLAKIIFFDDPKTDLRFRDYRLQCKTVKMNLSDNFMNNVGEFARYDLVLWVLQPMQAVLWYLRLYLCLPAGVKLLGSKFMRSFDAS